MVDQNYILYINSKHDLRAVKISLSEISANHNLKFSIPEKHLICGMILRGMPIKADRLKNFPFKPIEKYLFEFSNIHFTIPEMEFTTENTEYNFNIVSLEDIFPVIILPAMGVIVEIDAASTMVYNFIDEVDARVYGGATGYASQGLLFHYKRPGETEFTIDVFYNYGNEQDLTDYYNPASELQVFPSGTEFYFSDERLEFADTNHFFMP